MLAQAAVSALRHDNTLMVLFRDQKKGFNQLLEQAGYDSYTFFCLGKAVPEFDGIQLTNWDLIVKTPYGATHPFLTTGQIKQGDLASSWRFVIAMAMGTYGVKENFPESVINVRTMNVAAGVFHTPVDRFILKLQSVAATDNTQILARTVLMLSQVTYLFEVFQVT